ncbi:hypothetical protein ACFQ6B_23695 [Streptomyces wedmorensis]|uniref:Uncharacterized protein n=1 Tax=Streptomyces wedmorensis TaxID=43759 RepID=A0ABW6J709_STRWE
MRTAIQTCAEAFATFAQHLRAAGHIDEQGRPARRHGRPAWQSPYGPPPRRRQR